MAEIEEAQLVNYKTLADFVQRGLANPKTRSLLKQAEKELFPDRAVPEVDAKAEVMEEMAKLREQQANFIKEQEEREAKRKEEEGKANLGRQWQTGQQKARAAGYTDDGLKALETMMEERGIFDHEIAMPFFEKLHPPPEPTTVGSGQGWNFFEKPSDGPLKEAMDALLEGHDEAFLQAAIPDALKEARGR